MLSTLLLPLQMALAGQAPATQDLAMRKDGVAFTEKAEVRHFDDVDAATVIRTVKGSSKKWEIINFEPRAARPKPKDRGPRVQKCYSSKTRRLARGKAQTQATRRLAERLASISATIAREEAAGKLVDDGFAHLPMVLSAAYTSAISYLLHSSDDKRHLPEGARALVHASELHVHLTAIVKLLPTLAAARDQKHDASRRAAWGKLNMVLWEWVSSAQYRH
ncbi:hypothetical protein EJ03DRAFT_374149, partial [Teratosphaeria nubilosa]